MSLNMLEMLTAIRVRLEASSGGFFRGNKVYVFQAPADVTPKVGQLPVVVVSGVSATQRDSFGTDALDLTFLVAIVDHKANGEAPMFAAYTRVYGNAAPPNTAPTFGLHRHTPTMATGSNQPGNIVWEQADTLFDDTDSNAIGWVLRFSVSHQEA
jgi:hypothetical protein